MRPRNKAEREIVKMSESLPTITGRQTEWAYRNAFLAEALHTRKKNVCRCSECGQEFEYNPLKSVAYCPHCGRELHTNITEYKKPDAYEYFSVVTTKNDWQVVRYYLAHKTTGIGKKAEMEITEVSQRWHGKNGELYVLECGKRMGWRWSRQPYIYGSLSLKNYDFSYDRCGRDLFTMGKDGCYPVRRYTEWAKKIGLDYVLGKWDDIDIKSAQKFGTKFETICKWKNDRLISRYLYGRNKTTQMDGYWKPLLIAMKMNYFDNVDITMWYDHLDLLNELHMDIHNPFYICPKDFANEHARILKRAEKEKIKNEMIRDMERAREENDEYVKRMQKFFDIEIDSKNLTIKPLKSVMEFVEEGTAMHHCVYKCGYYLEDKHCLILSAKDNKGNRVETIEVSLKDYTITQSRAICNGTSDYHDEILDAVNGAMDEIRKAMNNKMTKVA